MELRHLRYFIAVAEKMNFHRAAKSLNISQPPLSLTIKNLEEEIGAYLFRRTGRSIKITRAGEEFLRYAKKTIHDSELAKENAYLIGNGKKGILKIGFVSSAITGILQEIVLDSKKANPDIKLNISQSVNGWLGKQVLNEEYDIGIIRHPEYLEDGLKVKELTKEGWCAVFRSNHRLAKNKSVTIEELAEEAIIFYPRYNNPAGYDDVMGMFQSKNLNPYVIQEAPEQMTIASLVAGDVGVGIVPSCMQKVGLSDLKHLPIKGAENRTGFSMIYRNDPDELIKSFLTSVSI